MRDLRFVKHAAAAVLGASLVFGGLTAGVGSITPTVSAQEVQAGAPAYTDVDFLNVRSTPSLKGTITTVIPYQTGLTLLSGPVTADGYDWFQVQLRDGTTGWCVRGFTIGSAPVGAGTPPATPTTPTTPAPGSFIYGDPVAVNTDLLNVRSGPSISASVLTVYAYGTEARVTGDATVADGYTWYPIDDLGWVAGQYLVLNACGCRGGIYPPDDETGTPTTPTPDMDFNVTTDALNVRSGPGLSSPVVGTLYFGDAVTQYGEARTADGYTWIPIDAGQTQWVAAQFVG